MSAPRPEADEDPLPSPEWPSETAAAGLFASALNPPEEPEEIGEEESAPTAVEPPLEIPDYIIGELIGRGGMSSVYKGIQICLNRPVAIKVMSPKLAADPSFVERFKREAQALANLNHPNIVSILESGHTSDGRLFLAMEYVDGTDFYDLIAQRCLTQEGALNALSQICDAMSYAHSKFYIHRDLKPANIFLNKDGVVKVGDFGLAKMICGDPAEGVTTEPLQMGTPPYCAPEQWNGLSVDARADIFSLGVMFYEMLTQEPLPKYVRRVPPPSRKVSVRPGVDHVVHRATEPEATKRYPTAAEMRKEVDEIQRAHVPWRLVAALLVLLCAAIAIGALYSPPPPPPPELPSFTNGHDMKFVPLAGFPGVLMAETETTRAVFRQFTLATPLHQEGGLLVLADDLNLDKLDLSATWDHHGIAQDDNQPVVGVNRQEARDFCAWLSKEEGELYRLPTDAEWQAAAGTAFYPWGSHWPPLGGDAGNYYDRSAELHFRRVLYAESKKYNDEVPFIAAPGKCSKGVVGPFRDLGGNVWEWCDDDYRADLNLDLFRDRLPFLNNERDYQTSAPLGLVRGGSWYYLDKNYVSLQFRYPRPVEHRSIEVGFRCVLVRPTDAAPSLEK